MAKIEVNGHLGGDAELKFSNSGRPVLNFSVGDSKSRKDQNGNWETLKSQWIRAALWGDEAEFYQSRLVKGTKVTVWGEFFAREYERNGEKRTSLDLEVHGVKIWPKRDGQGGGNQQSQPQQQNNGWGQPAQSSGGWEQVPPQEPPF